MSKRKEPVKRFPCRLRTLALVLLVVGAGFGWLGTKMKKARDQRLVVTALKARGWSVVYDWERSAGEHGPFDAQRAKRSLLRRLLGDDFFDRVIAAQVGNENVPGDGDLQHLTKLRDLEVVSIVPWGSQVSDEGLLVFRRLPKLKTLLLHNCLLTDDGVVHLVTLKNLKTLNITNARISDASVRQFRNMTQLRKLYLTDTLMTDQSVSALSAALPNCKIEIHTSTEIRLFLLDRIPGEPK